MEEPSSQPDVAMSAQQSCKHSSSTARAVWRVLEGLKEVEKLSERVRTKDPIIYIYIWIYIYIYTHEQPPLFRLY